MLYLKDGFVDRDVLFIHIPKCAGTSIEKLFNRMYDEKEYIEYDFNLITNIEHPKHLTLMSYYKHHDNNVLNNAFKFTIIRNPYELMVSKYNYAINSEKVYLNGSNSSEYKKKIPFNTYVLFVYRNSKKDDRLLTQNVSSFRKFIEYDNHKMDFIGRFENLKEDVDIICNEVGIENTLEVTNRLEYDRDYRKYYDKMSKELVSIMFYHDLKKYNYKF